MSQNHSVTGTRPGDLSIPFTEYDLENGLHVILSPARNAPLVITNLWYHVGSKDEDPRRTGFAHLFEHMMFQGSEHVGGCGLGRPRGWCWGGWWHGSGGCFGVSVGGGAAKRETRSRD